MGVCTKGAGICCCCCSFLQSKGRTKKKKKKKKQIQDGRLLLIFGPSPWSLDVCRQAKHLKKKKGEKKRNKRKKIKKQKKKKRNPRIHLQLSDRGRNRLCSIQHEAERDEGDRFYYYFNFFLCSLSSGPALETSKISSSFTNNGGDA